MSQGTETTETTDYVIERPGCDYHHIAWDPIGLAVFVHADGAIQLQVHVTGMTTMVTVPATHRDALLRAISTPYSGSAS